MWDVPFLLELEKRLEAQELLCYLGESDA